MIEGVRTESRVVCREGGRSPLARETCLERVAFSLAFSFYFIFFTSFFSFSFSFRYFSIVWLNSVPKGGYFFCLHLSVNWMVPHFINRFLVPDALGAVDSILGVNLIHKRI